MTRVSIRTWSDIGHGPALVLLHGWGASGAFFAAQEALGGQGVRVLIPDLPGHGPTAVSDPGLTVPDLTDAVAAFLVDRQVEKPVLVGWSMGALVALDLLHRHRMRAAGLSILDMTPKVPNGPDWAYGIAGGQTEADMVATASAMAAGWGDFAPRIAFSLFARGAPPDPVWLAEATARLAAQDAPTLANLWRSLASTDARPALAALDIPIQVILGARSRIYGPTLADFYRADVPRADLTVLEGAGHAPQIEQPAAINAALLAFVQRVTAVA